MFQVRLSCVVPRACEAVGLPRPPPVLRTPASPLGAGVWLMIDFCVFRLQLMRGFFLNHQAGGGGG